MHYILCQQPIAAAYAYCTLCRQLFPDQKPYKPPVSIPTQPEAAAAPDAMLQSSAQQDRPPQEAAGQLLRASAAAEKEAVQYLELRPADILPPQPAAQASGQHPHSMSSQQPATPAGDPRIQQQQQQQHASGSQAAPVRQSVVSDPRLRQQQQQQSQPPPSGAVPGPAAAAQGSSIPSDPRLKQQQQQPHPVSLADPRRPQRDVTSSSGNTAAAGQTATGPSDPRRPPQPAASQAAAAQLPTPSDPRVRLDRACPEAQPPAHLPRPIILQAPGASGQLSRAGNIQQHSLNQGPTPVTLQPPGHSEQAGSHVSVPSSQSRPITLQPPVPGASGQMATQSDSVHQHPGGLHGSANGGVPQHMQQGGPGLQGQGGYGAGVGNASKGDDAQRGGVPKPITLRPPQQGQQFQAHTFEYRR